MGQRGAIGWRRWARVGVAGLCLVSAVGGAQPSVEPPSADAGWIVDVGEDAGAWLEEASVQARRVTGVGDELTAALQLKGELLTEVAVMQDQLGQTDTAERNHKLVRLCIRALRHSGDDGWIHAARAKALQKIGDESAARAALDKISRPAERQVAELLLADHASVVGTLNLGDPQITRGFASQLDTQGLRAETREKAAALTRTQSAEAAAAWIDTLDIPALRAIAAIGVAEALLDPSLARPRYGEAETENAEAEQPAIASAAPSTTEPALPSPAATPADVKAVAEAEDGAASADMTGPTVTVVEVADPIDDNAEIETAEAVASETEVPAAAEAVADIESPTAADDNQTAGPAELTPEAVPVPVPVPGEGVANSISPTQPAATADTAVAIDEPGAAEAPAAAELTVAVPAAAQIETPTTKAVEPEPQASSSTDETTGADAFASSTGEEETVGEAAAEQAPAPAETETVDATIPETTAEQTLAPAGVETFDATLSEAAAASAETPSPTTRVTESAKADGPAPPETDTAEVEAVAPAPPVEPTPPQTAEAPETPDAPDTAMAAEVIAPHTVAVPVAAPALTAAPTAESSPTAAPAVIVPSLRVLAEPDRVLDDAPAPAVYDVKFVTTQGPFVVRVHRDWAPAAADRFHDLSRAGFYHNQRFFRVVSGFVAQWGIHGYPKVAAAWRPQTFADEPRTQPNRRGTIVFAAAATPDTRTTQVFINLANNDYLDDLGFTPFGEVVEGMDVVDQLFGGYGEAPSEKQRDVQLRGNALLDALFPELDSIIAVRVNAAE
ncbi:MAG: peptidylprolyl isomerase [Planctomycetota bacterium]